jgi:hypothetical protein
MAVVIRHADHVALTIRKLALTSPTSGGRSVGILVDRWRTQATEFVFVLCHSSAVAPFVSEQGKEVLPPRDKRGVKVSHGTDCSDVFKLYLSSS